jgi:hypothetical protein
MHIKFRTVRFAGKYIWSPVFRNNINLSKRERRALGRVTGMQNQFVFSEYQIS